ncbi:MAG: HNH endonuclease [Thioploca sp.]|nr:HNH endonuclease [Thioploca sp.]
MLRAKRAADAAKNAAKKQKCKTCKPPPGNRFGTRSPKEGSNGTWHGGERGDSTWHPDPNTEKGQAVLNATGGKPIEFKDGYPDFSDHALHRVEIEMTGDNSIDFPAANKAAGLKETPKDWTWHHKEDGVTMELIPSDLNNNIPHTGGASMVRDPGY